MYCLRFIALLLVVGNIDCMQKSMPTSTVDRSYAGLVAAITVGAATALYSYTSFWKEINQREARDREKINASAASQKVSDVGVDCYPQKPPLFSDCEHVGSVDQGQLKTLAYYVGNGIGTQTDQNGLIHVRHENAGRVGRVVRHDYIDHHGKRFSVLSTPVNLWRGLISSVYIDSFEIGISREKALGIAAKGFAPIPLGCLVGSDGANPVSVGSDVLEEKVCLVRLSRHFPVPKESIYVIPTAFDRQQQCEVDKINQAREIEQKNMLKTSLNGIIPAFKGFLCGGAVGGLAVLASNYIKRP